MNIREKLHKKYLLLPNAYSMFSFHVAFQAQFTAPSYLDGDNKFFCEGCGTRCDAVRRTVLRAFPPVLVATLERFAFDLEVSNRLRQMARVDETAQLLGPGPALLWGIALAIDSTQNSCVATPTSNLRWSSFFVVDFLGLKEKKTNMAWRCTCCDAVYLNTTICL